MSGVSFAGAPGREFSRGYRSARAVPADLPDQIDLVEEDIERNFSSSAAVVHNHQELDGRWSSRRWR
jgi:hypothetical protein